MAKKRRVSGENFGTECKNISLGRGGEGEEADRQGRGLMEQATRFLHRKQKGGILLQRESLETLGQERRGGKV